MQLSHRFWFFHSGFWAVSGFLLFLSGWAQGGAYVSLIRNLYLTGAGLLLAWPLVVLLGATKRFDHMKRLPLVGFVCYAASLLTVLVINPVTAIQLGLSYDDMGFRVLTAGSLNYAFVLALWCFFHEAFVTAPASRSRDEPLQVPQTVSVQKGQATLKLDVATIDWIAAAGDYVEIHAGGDSFLKRSTMAAMEKVLPAGLFLRVHRSCIVARAAVVAVEGRSKGAFQLQLRDGAHIDTGRSYHDRVKEVFGGE